MSGCSRIGGLALVFLAAVGIEARAADSETRDFQVLVNGKPSGVVYMTIHGKDNTQARMNCDTDIKVKHPLGTYKFSYRGQEVWEAGRLKSFSSTTDDNGKRYLVAAVRTDKGVVVKANNVEKLVSQETWLTSYWFLPDAKLRSQMLTIIDADDGKVLAGKMTFVGIERQVVAGQTVNVNHYRLAGKVKVDLWYDGFNRLVRQESVEDGHKVVIVLTRLRM